jgi:hypothetical protein
LAVDLDPVHPKKHVGHLRQAVEGRLMERTAPVLPASIGICARVHQQLNHRLALAPCCNLCTQQVQIRTHEKKKKKKKSGVKRTNQLQDFTESEIFFNHEGVAAFMSGD